MTHPPHCLWKEGAFETGGTLENGILLCQRISDLWGSVASQILFLYSGKSKILLRIFILPCLKCIITWIQKHRICKDTEGCLRFCFSFWYLEILRLIFTVLKEGALAMSWWPGLAPHSGWLWGPCKAASACLRTWYSVCWQFYCALGKQRKGAPACIFIFTTEPCKCLQRQ